MTRPSRIRCVVLVVTATAALGGCSKSQLGRGVLGAAVLGAVIAHNANKAPASADAPAANAPPQSAPQAQVTAAPVAPPTPPARSIAATSPAPAVPAGGESKFLAALRKSPFQPNSDAEAKRRFKAALGQDFPFFAERLGVADKTNDCGDSLTATACMVHHCDTEHTVWAVDKASEKIHVGVLSEKFGKQVKMLTGHPPSPGFQTELKALLVHLGYIPDPNPPRPQPVMVPATPAPAPRPVAAAPAAASDDFEPLGLSVQGTFVLRGRSDCKSSPRVVITARAVEFINGSDVMRRTDVDYTPAGNDESSYSMVTVGEYGSKGMIEIPFKDDLMIISSDPEFQRRFFKNKQRLSSCRP